MPVYNGQRFLDEAIESVLAQDFEDFELVIVDDGSTDETPLMLARWAKHDSRVVVLTHETNEGISRALNRGLRASRGEFVARLDADDVCLPGRFTRQVMALDAHRDVVLVSAGYELIDARGRHCGRVTPFEPPEVTEYLLHFSNALGGHSQVMYRREVVQQAGFYSEAQHLSEDYELWTRLLQFGRIMVLPMIAMKYRQHDDRVTVKWFGQQRGFSLATTRRMLTSLLGRELTEEEFHATVAVWRADMRGGNAALAHAIFVEAYREFRRRNQNRMHRRRVRVATAMRWVMRATVLARRGELLEALRHFAYAVVWHPLGLVEGAAGVAQRAAFRLRFAFSRTA